MPKNMKKTFQEIIEILKEKLNDDVAMFAYHDFDQDKIGLGEIKEVTQKGGEGEGNEWYSVKYFTDHDIYIRVDGYYSSYNGTDFDNGWDCCEEVKPQQKTITVYESK